jgi:ABC-type glycerol-3-phosphate transport system substrate-binding protein
LSSRVRRRSRVGTGFEQEVSWFWFWSWALAILASSKKVDAAKSFLKWDTSKEYFEMVGEPKGWVAV